MGAFFAVTLLALLTLHQSRANPQHCTILAERTNLTQENALENALVTRDLTRRWFGSSNSRPGRNRGPQRVQISVPLEWRGFRWVAPIDIGTPAKRFYVIIDTNSANFWIKCDMSYSSSRRFIRPRIMYQDYINIGGLREQGRFLTPQFLWKMSYDGILGLRLSASRLYSLPKGIPFVPNFLQKYVDPPVFSLYLGSTNPQLHIGEPQLDYYVGGIEYHNVTNPSRWEIGPAIMSATDGVTEAYRISGIKTVFDSSIYGIIGPPSDVKKIYKALREGKPTSEGPYTFPCNRLIEIHLKWNDGSPWIITHHQFNLGQVGPTSCAGIIQPGPMFSKGWRIGTIFLATVYTVYDSGMPRMGIAVLPQHLAAPPPYETAPPLYEAIPI
ncbi:hypothetical protein APHAL10511_008167 [Amanita phalloides]|nr:hypothetical protein APHAL10511_008167 [Amanita phalloides]